MSLGFPGPISSLAEYALSRTYQIRSAQRNAIHCLCKGCGKDCARGHGFQVWIVGQFPTRLHPYYFCRDCFLPVKEAWNRWPLVRPLPRWWKSLEMPLERTRTQREPLPAEELDRIIAERESKSS